MVASVRKDRAVILFIIVLFCKQKYVRNAMIPIFTGILGFY